MGRAAKCGTPGVPRRLRPAVAGRVALYERLFTEAYPSNQDGRDPLEFLNPASRTILEGARFEPVLAETAPGELVQFERVGYFCADSVEAGLFHRTVGLKDDWAKIRKRNG